MKVTANIEIDHAWAEHIIITALDGAYGGSLYWTRNLDDDGTYLRQEWKEDENGTVYAVELTPAGTHAVDYEAKRLDVTQLSEAVTKVYNEHKGYVGEYVRRAVADEDPADIDADAADVLLQLAYFGEVVYG